MAESSPINASVCVPIAVCDWIVKLQRFYGMTHVAFAGRVPPHAAGVSHTQLGLR